MPFKVCDSFVVLIEFWPVPSLDNGSEGVNMNIIWLDSQEV